MTPWFFSLVALLATYIPPPASAPLVGSNALQQLILSSPFQINPQTGTYQALASDFSNYKTISVASGSFTITLVASGSQPPTGQFITVQNYGSGTVTIARSGQNINGGTASLTLAAGSATAPTSLEVWSDGTNYFSSGAAGSSSGAGSITVNPGAQTCTIGSSCTIPLSAVNPQTATYQVLAADFSNYKLISVASGTFTITLVASGTQPAAGQYITIQNYGSGTVTIARSGQNINGGTASLTLPAGSATAPASIQIWSDGSNYFSGGAAGAAVGSVTVNPGATVCTVNGSACTVPLSAVNPQTATYQVLAADFAAYKLISVASGTFTITLVASGSQPPAGQYIVINNYGSGIVTIAASGQNINGAATSLALPAALSAQAPVSARIWSDGTNYFAEMGIAPTDVVQTPSSSLTANVIPVGQGLKEIGNSLFQVSSNVLEATGRTNTVTYQNGQDGNGGSASGNLIVRGADCTASTNTVACSGALLRSGINAYASAGNSAGILEILAAPSTGASNTGLQPLLVILDSFAISGTVTQWGLVCFTSAPKTVTNCGASPSNIAGVAVSLTGTISVTVAMMGSDIPVTASAAVTIGDTVCAGTTAAQVTDSGTTINCTIGVTVGTVVATTGVWPAFPDGTSFPTVTTTLPVVHLRHSFN